MAIDRAVERHVRPSAQVFTLPLVALMGDETADLHHHAKTHFGGGIEAGFIFEPLSPTP
jgi:hypothetical protein